MTYTNRLNQTDLASRIDSQVTGQHIQPLHCTARCGQLAPREQRVANAYARKVGYHSATRVEFTDYWSIQCHTRYGYRKYTTGEYVPNAYRTKGWTNTYYQPAITVVTVPKYTTPCSL